MIAADEAFSTYPFRQSVTNLAVKYLFELFHSIQIYMHTFNIFK